MNNIETDVGPSSYPSRLFQRIFVTILMNLLFNCIRHFIVMSWVLLESDLIWGGGTRYQRRVLYVNFIFVEMFVLYPLWRYVFVKTGTFNEAVSRRTNFRVFQRTAG
ncbi:uncharacterized protein BCR38DRAFT_435742 [Pseudomassariella vexata]|uniref:Uncharacterized protein n=1 Tax=Pseudomassariella vexata TaxID=1141098 RepID=A0A1Y2DUW4_9PEZI|nr:uncharacterized protein BCR38DRAFT_435742 [Pseudomassariella vexata]ORY63048.1 hypothetical protein BCR38DRAFT_435742 [Pseudomassariella vexata]